jgi:hypothetical protein
MKTEEAAAAAAAIKVGKGIRRGQSERDPLNALSKRSSVVLV